MTEGGLLDTLPAPVQPVPGEADEMERVHDRDPVRGLLGGGGIESGEPIHRYDLAPVPPSLRSISKPNLEHGLGASLDHIGRT